MQKFDPAILAHLEWLGFVRPTGLVVSAPALVRAGALLPRNDSEGQRLLAACVEESPSVGPHCADFTRFAREVLGWSFSPKGYAGHGVAQTPIPPELQVDLPEYGEILAPDLAVRERDPAPNASPWQLVVRVLPTGQAFDAVVREHGKLEASPHGRMERLLRQTGVSAGLLWNGVALRLISAPRGESSGWLDFRVAEMVQTAGRPMVAALRLLLSEQRLLALPPSERLAALLAASRSFQNEVSERLAEQVLHALYALLRGFQAANADTHGTLLHAQLRDDADAVYRGLLTVILRLVFLLYAEERDMLPKEATWQQGYSLAGLYERLREDAALYPDTMQQRYGAWAHLLVLFRMIHDGVEAGALHLPRRHGVLFDPDRFPFLEGRATGMVRQQHQRMVPPRVPDGTVYEALEQLLVLDGERISYRALDVEQIGSVYETMMGFRLETATGQALAIRAGKKGGAPTTISLDALLATPSAKRGLWLREQTERSVPAGVGKALQTATTIADLHAALRPIVDLAATPDMVPPGAMVLQPSAERRRSGSHYTPRALTEPIVRTTLEPILARLRDPQTGMPSRPAAILDLKICDPAMGSGAFLVEACRQLGDALIEAWHVHGGRPPLPPDEDEVVFARRLVAQRCLYGVDKNPTAVDLARVSLWLVTLAKDHPFTFVDHALRHGDSLVGLSLRQIERFHWHADGAATQDDFYTSTIRQQVRQVADLRTQIRHASDDLDDAALRTLWGAAQDELSRVRLYGDLVLAAFFAGDKPKTRETRRIAYAEEVKEDRATAHLADLEAWRHAEMPLVPFHWEIEFPEVFQRANPGFDAVVGNPPFLGGTKISTNFGASYLEWLLSLHERAHGNADLVAHFFRRAFNLLRQNSTVGLIATNTIAQGDTRSTGLRWICEHGGTIYHANNRVKWPGLAAVIVSVVHIAKISPSVTLSAAKRPASGALHSAFGSVQGDRKDASVQGDSNVLTLPSKQLDGRTVEQITAFLFHRGGNGDPVALRSNAGISFTGAKIYGQGFTFDDSDGKGISSSIAEMHALIASNPINQAVIFPYIGGEELNSSPSHTYHRYVINFGERSEEECRERWPNLMKIVETKVKPERLILKDTNDGLKLKATWWQFGRTRQELYTAIASLKRVLANSQVSAHLAFAFLPSTMVYSHALNVYPLPTYAAFCALQSSLHEIWARFFGSSLEDRLRYTPSDCFETFPFPADWATHPALEAAGQAYYDYRAALMVRNNEGLTKTYNRFHDPYEHDPEIEQLRALHAAMDRAVLAAYGWEDIPTACDFLLDYEIDEAEWGTKKKPYRYRWPDEVRDEVLARLLELNARRAEEEALAGKGKATGKGKKQPVGMRDMFEG
ncbi:N-6 DNA methylase [Candidatus Chloroploca sp. M-50]|uniref:site-specific DNA-methyltransferase (adenine-specific) n=1 Tax=Candidatus Chloroploca mongolica TaxID=2528176 RepID=A0ABS4DG71_9CHLR|nr:DNA methyltransferase [Candidatus Chloroploca mongolica]MBP1468420.1 N-6 DNA methylase [Candidatus Chloroploca mongolica]